MISGTFFLKHFKIIVKSGGDVTIVLSPKPIYILL